MHPDSLQRALGGGKLACNTRVDLKRLTHSATNRLEACFHDVMGVFARHPCARARNLRIRRKCNEEFLGKQSIDVPSGTAARHNPMKLTPAE